ncbi:MAG: rRNA pseudouridine synthase [Ignavibacterium sp.]|nr:MAG: rRNA pseudouridine synthase [Ignavibacterium sp.]
MRINKYIADSGITSRRKAEELILQGRVSVNNSVVENLSYRINPERDNVFIDGERIKIKRNVYYLLNKPRGVISSTKDEKNRNTIIDLIKTKEKIFPVGRLDYNTTGILLLTNDGDFSNLLTHPKNKVPKKYEVNLDKELDQKDKSKLLNGILIDKKKGRFTNIKFLNTTDKKLVEVECVEGRNRFVKRMFESLRYQVKKLNRSYFAGLQPDIPVGNYRELSKREVQKIKERYTIEIN